MENKDYGKLVKLTIKNMLTKETFTVMFNPESYTETFSNLYRKVEDVNTGMEEYVYVKTLPYDFRLKLIIDGTGVTDYSSSVFPALKESTKSVYERVNEFLRLAWYPEEGQAKPLLIEWGDFSYHCFLKDVTINHVLFDRKGHSLRAELDAVFISNSEQFSQHLKNRFELKQGGTPAAQGGSSSPANRRAEEPGPAGSLPEDKVSNGIVISVS